ncbi:uncharacterized protein A4U43_C01F27850 [Asparagus officinalis]|uniref:Uncharacterized protein n=1 Tax=Asparagus officinalis TaxID=4686 RepID=A0A5P1FV65_ASPOF|nr:uncharacterized protein A4U43_C01F27850 [Asparagus officinalis]
MAKTPPLSGLLRNYDDARRRPGPAHGSPVPIFSITEINTHQKHSSPRLEVMSPAGDCHPRRYPGNLTAESTVRLPVGYDESPSVRRVSVLAVSGKGLVAGLVLSAVGDHRRHGVYELFIVKI